MIFLFGGQGSQLPQMGQDLLDFSEAREVYDLAFAKEPSLQDLFTLDAKAISQTKYSQPAIALHQLAMVRIFETKGIKPRAVLGLSIGEFPALYAAGYLSLEDCIDVILRRAKLMSSLLKTRQDDGMLAVIGPSRTEIEAILKTQEGVSLANINSPKQHVLSGPRVALEKLEPQLKEKRARLVYLDVEGAFHSRFFEPCIEPLEEKLRSVEWHEPQSKMYFNRTGGAAEDLPRVMAEQLARPLELDACLDELLQDLGTEALQETFVEFAAKPVLLPFVKRKNRKLKLQHCGTKDDFKFLEG